MVDPAAVATIENLTRDVERGRLLTVLGETLELKNRVLLAQIAFMLRKHHQPAPRRMAPVVVLLVGMLIGALGASVGLCAWFGRNTWTY